MSGRRDLLTFEEVWNLLDPTERQLWRDAIQKEFGHIKGQSSTESKTYWL